MSDHKARPSLRHLPAGPVDGVWHFTDSDRLNAECISRCRDCGQPVYGRVEGAHFIWTHS